MQTRRQTRRSRGNEAEPQGLATVSLGGGLVASDRLVADVGPSSSEEVEEGKWRDAFTFEQQGDLCKESLKKTLERRLNIILTHKKSYLRKGDWYVYYFSCAEVKRCKCTFAVRALCPGTDIKVQVSGSHNEHSVMKRMSGLSAQCKLAVVEQILQRNSPLLAHEALCSKYGCTYTQVKYFYSNYASKIKRASWPDTIRAWTAWCNERPFVADRTENHEVCVLHHRISEEDFIIILSTPALLYTRVEQGRHQTSFKMADATYKITWEGLPLLVMGTTDWRNTFLPTAYALTMHEREQEFGLFEKYVSRAVLDLARDRGEKAAVLVSLEGARLLCSDAAGAIPQGEKLAHPSHNEKLSNMCYSHMIRKVRQVGLSHINSADRKKKRDLHNELLKDLQKMRWIVSCSQFELAVRLFHKKWCFGHKQKDVIAWLFLRGGWLGQKRRWARCHVPVGLPSSTNALERHKRAIKDLLRRKRDPSHRAIGNIADGVVAHWSAQLLPEYPLSAGPDVPQKLWDDTQWYIKKQAECPDLFGYEVEGYITFPSQEIWDRLYASATRAALEKKEIESKMTSDGHCLAGRFAHVWARTDSFQYRERRTDVDVVVPDPDGNPLTFDSLMAWLGSFYVLTPLKAQRGACPSKYDCSCPDGSKDGVCKHSLSLTVRQGFSIPNDLRHGVVGNRRGPGRPKKTSPALFLQPDAHLLLPSEEK